MSEQLALIEDTTDVKVPRQYKMLMAKIDQSLAVLSEGPPGLCIPVKINLMVFLFR